METIDIRTTNDNVTKIQFATNHGDNAYILTKNNSYDGQVAIKDGNSNLFIASKEDAENLIKALNKAIELNWFVY